MAAGPDAILKPTGYDVTAIPRGDDTSNLVVNLPFAMNWNGTNFTQIYINMNGNCTFGSGYTGYNPNTTLAATNRNIMAPFWADVDTRNTGASQVTYSDVAPGSVPQVDGRDAFFVNWIGVASYNNQSAPTNSFQLVIVDRSDTGAGNFDFMYNYDEVAWDIATAASTVRARVGWGRAGTGFELPGSGTAAGSPSALLDGSPAETSLVQNTMNADGQLGRYVWQVRGGTAPNTPPEITVTDRVLEGNAPNSYTGYTGEGDASAIDPDGSIAAFTNDLPATLPLGITEVTWTATDDRGAVTTASQSIEVTDSTAPSNPLVSSTGMIGVWSTNSTVSVESSGATDVCTGVHGFSYSWSRDATTVPDTILDSADSTTVTQTVDVLVEEQAFPDATWPSDWTRVRIADAGDPATYIRSQNTRANSGYAAELWTNSQNTRRTAGFVKQFDLAGLESATLSFADRTAQLDAGTDYAQVEFSDDGGGSWTTLRYTSANVGWTQRSYSLPVGGFVQVRFSGSVNRTDEYCNWDDILIDGTKTTETTTYSTSETTQLEDGTWYYNLHTVDGAGNWSEPTSIGPFLIDTTAPVTTDDAPVGWSTSAVPVTLTPTDAGLVTLTRYSLDGGPWTDYTSPINITAEGTSTLNYYSADAAGHVEVTRTATVRVDTQPPSMPTSAMASAISTNAIEIAWGLSTDAVSGLSYYAVYRDATLVATTTATFYVDSGLTPGDTYSYRVCAVDVAGNESARTPAVTETVPMADLWISLDVAGIDMGATDPGNTSTVIDASTVSVGGVGELGYDLLCSAQDFTNVDAGASMLSLPASALAFEGRGHALIPQNFFGNTPSVINSSVGSEYSWSHQYTFDYHFVVPWTFEAGVYTTTVTYTVVGN